MPLRDKEKFSAQKFVRGKYTKPRDPTPPFSYTTLKEMLLISYYTFYWKKYPFSKHLEWTV